jgi:hypothetical protein
MQPGFFCNSGASLLSSLLTTTTLWGSLLSSSLLTTLLWGSLCSSLLTTTLWCSLSSSLLTTTLWCCLSSSFLTTLCSHVDFLSEWFDPSPNLFKANRDSIYGNFPLFWVKNAPACRNSFFQKSVHLHFFKGPKSAFFMRKKCKKRVFQVFYSKFSDLVTRG